MKTIIRAHQLKLTDSLRNYTQQKLHKPVQRLVNSPATRLTIKLSYIDSPKDKSNKRCHITLSAPHLKPVNIYARDENMYNAIDRAHHTIVRQVKRQQLRKMNRARRAS